MVVESFSVGGFGFGGINKKCLERVYGIKEELFSKGVKVKKGG